MNLSVTSCDSHVICFIGFISNYNLYQELGIGTVPTVTVNISLLNMKIWWEGNNGIFQLSCKHFSLSHLWRRLGDKFDSGLFSTLSYKTCCNFRWAGIGHLKTYKKFCSVRLLIFWQRWRRALTYLWPARYASCPTWRRLLVRTRTFLSQKFTCLYQSCSFIFGFPRSD